jgi:hypothetical protein
MVKSFNVWWDCTRQKKIEGSEEEGREHIFLEQDLEICREDVKKNAYDLYSCGVA